MFQIKKNNIRIDFDVDTLGHVFYSYFGTTDINFLKENHKATKLNILELQLSSYNHNGNHCDKQIDSEYCKTAKYVSYTFKDNELIIITRNNDVEINTHYKFYENCDGFTIFNKVKNISNHDIVIEYITSFHLYGFGSESSLNHNDMILHKAYNSWHQECQWTHNKFLDEGIFNANHNVNMRSFKINNTGSWSTKEFLPMIGVSDTKKNINILSQIENNGSWHIELGDYFNSFYLNLCGPNFIDNKCAIKLEPNKSFTSCKASVVISTSIYKSIQEITKLRRNIIDKDSIDYKEMPIIYNDFMHANWERQDEGRIISLVDDAKKAGADIFVIDAGWFNSRFDWPSYIGNWEEDPLNYPNGGLLKVFNYIRSKGMKVGIWTEIEVMGINCPLVKDLSDDCFFSFNNQRVIYNNRYFLNFNNKKAYNWALNTLSNIIDKYHIDYLKNDYNENIGSGSDDKYSSIGESLLLHNRALIRLLNELKNKYPNLTIESCASGGQRMDYETLKVCHIQSTSDQEEYYLYPYISSNIFSAVVPEQAGIWSYPINCRAKSDIKDEEVVFNMVNSFLGRIHLASKLNKLTSFQMELVKDATDLYNQLKEFKKVALPIFPLGTSFFYKDEYVSSGLIHDNKIILSVWNMTDNNKIINIPLNEYKVKDIKVLYPTKLDTKYKFDKENSVLSYDSFGYTARVFLINLDINN